MKKLDVLVAVLLVVGGLNWGLVAFANFDLVAFVSRAGAFGEKNAILVNRGLPIPGEIRRGLPRARSCIDVSGKTASRGRLAKKAAR